MKSKSWYISSVIFILTIILFLLRFSLAHQIDPQNLLKIKKGMNKSKIETILGMPTIIKDNNSQWWYRYKKFIWCEVMLSFDKNGNYVSKFHDH